MDNAAPLQIRFGPADGPVLELPLERGGCWSSVLGDWALPGAGSIELMDRVIGQLDGVVESVRVSGCASSALLPIVWCRTIWFGGATRLVLDWDSVVCPAGAPGRQAAGLLACELADEVECADPTRAAAEWGFGAPSSGARAFDLLGALLECWDDAPVSADWTETMGRALARCDALGHGRVGLYGAGTHTRQVGEALADAPVEIACVIDDDVRRHGARLWGFPIVSLEEACSMALDAVILSGNSIEGLLWARSAPLRAAGVSVVRLYGEGAVVETRLGGVAEVTR